MLGRIYYQEGRIDYAIGQFERVLRINPRSYKAFDNIGLCYESRGDTDIAIRYYLTAIKLVEKDHPDYDWAYANLANLLVDKGDPEKAFAAASKAADRNPYSARNFYIGGKALHKLGKIELSVNWLERAAALDPEVSRAPVSARSRLLRVGQGGTGEGRDGEVSRRQGRRSAPAQVSLERW